MGSVEAVNPVSGGGASGASGSGIDMADIMEVVGSSYLVSAHNDTGFDISRGVPVNFIASARGKSVQTPSANSLIDGMLQLILAMMVKAGFLLAVIWLIT